MSLLRAISGVLVLLLCLYDDRARSEILDSECTDTHGGFVMFGQCFFIFGVNATYHEAWTYCKDQGATLAQVHTSFEFNQVVEQMNARINATSKKFTAWLALQRTDDRNASANDSCANGPVFWYDDESTQNPMLPIEKTWMKTHCGDDPKHLPGPQFWFVITKTGDVIDTDSSVISNSVYRHPLCQVPTCNRNYALSNKCITEDPILSIQSVDPQACAQECSNTLWCRSFNFKGCSGSSCELFAWISDEPCPHCAATSVVPGCSHYDAVQDLRLP